jgi:PAS domain S-box-containing protein
VLLTFLSSAFELAQNMALLVLGAFAYSLLRQPLSRTSAPVQIAADSVLFSLLVVITMLRPLVPQPGVYVDSRVVLVACSALFSGPLVGLAVSAVAIAFRLWMGGVAAWAGTIAVLCAFLVALAFRRWMQARRIEPHYRHLVALGIALGFCMLAGSVALPGRAVADVLSRATLPVLIVIPLATVLLGTVIIRTDQSRQLARRVADGAARFRTVLENLPVGVAIRDRAGRYTLVNKTFRERAGMAERDILGLTVRQLCDRLGLDPVHLDRDADILRGAPVVQHEPLQIEADGRREWIVVWNFPIHNAAGEIEAIGGTQAIVTDLIEAQRALQQREETLQRHQRALLDIVRDDAIKERRYEDALRVVTKRATVALDISHAAIYAIDVERDEQRCLDQWDREAGTHRPGPTAKWSEFKGLFPDYDRDRVVAIEDLHNDPRLISRAEVYKSVDARSMLTAAIYVEGQVRGRLMLGNAREPRTWSVEDIAFARSIAHLITLIFIDKERQELQDRLQQASKMEAIGRLAGGIAHDFNNLLASISGFAGFLVQDLPAGSELRVFAERILSACDRGNGLIGQVLALARSHSVEHRAFDLRAVLRESGEFLGGSLPKSTRISLEYSSEPLPVHGSDTQLSQVIMNLCVNANDALGGESGSIVVRLMRLTIDPAQDSAAPAPPLHRIVVGRLDPGRDYACIEVTDTGAGMSAAVLERIIEPFFTTKHRSRGTGLGLAVVNDIVASHGGAYRVESAAGHGTRVAVYIPLAAAQDGAAEGGGGPEASARGTERILVVDDQEEVDDMLVIGLGRLGYDAIGVTDPLEALQSLEEDSGAWDAVVTDDTMPAMRGLTLVSKAKAARPSLAVILCTGFNDGATDAAARAAGADAFFIKPVTPEQIAAKLRQLIRSRLA